MRFEKKSFVWLLAIVAASLMGLYFFFAFSLEYIDQKWWPHPRGASQQEVRNHLRWFTETQVDSEDVPEGYRTGWPAETAFVYRYRFLTYPLDIHVLYNEKMEALTWIPTYE